MIKRKEVKPKTSKYLGCELSFMEAVELMVKGMTSCIRRDIKMIPFDGGIQRFVCKGPKKVCPKCENLKRREDLTARWRRERFGY